MNSRGEKVAPKKVEAILYQLPGVTEAAVTGVPNGLRGQVTKALLVRGLDPTPSGPTSRASPSGAGPGRLYGPRVRRVPRRYAQDFPAQNPGVACAETASCVA